MFFRGDRAISLRVLASFCARCLLSWPYNWRYVTTTMISHATFALLLLVGLACADGTVRDGSSSATRVVAAAVPLRPATPVATAGSLPTRAAADSLLARYLARIVERDGFSPSDFAGMRSLALPCIEEQYGDVLHAYWLARGRVLGYVPDGDTLGARLELLTVAAQEPRLDTAYGSVVTARIHTDTLLLKLVAYFGEVDQSFRTKSITCFGPW